MGNYSRFADIEDIEQMAVVVAFDPGGTTGFCIMGVNPADLTSDHGMKSELLSLCEYGEIDCGSRHGQTGAGVGRGHDGLNMPGENNGVYVMLMLALRFPKAVIVLEDFILDANRFSQSRDLLLPVRITSSFSYGFSELERIFIQNRSMAKTTCTDERLKNWGLYDAHSGPHSRDATRHAFYFLRDCCGSGLDHTEKRYRAWPHLFEDPMMTGKQKARHRKEGERIEGL